MKTPNYVPIIKTTDAEIKGYENLTEETKKSILPIFELTKSRNTTKVPEGSIFRRMNQITDAQGSLPFILDLTSHEDLMNFQIEDLLDDTNGFENWFNFLNKYDELNIIPMVHAYLDEDLSEVTNSARNLEQKFSKVAFKIDAGNEDATHYIGAIKKGISNEKNLIIVIDNEYIEPDDITAPIISTKKTISDLSTVISPFCYVTTGSSFPAYVKKHPNGGDDYGNISMDEIALYNAVKQQFIHESICYGDYASIHPNRYKARGFSWVPRIDVPLDEKYIYTRYRRDNGGYVKAAQEMLDLAEYESANCWGDEQIEAAADGSPNGRSPSFWISVRLNIHITRQAKLRSANQ